MVLHVVWLNDEKSLNLKGGDTHSSKVTLSSKGILLL